MAVVPASGSTLGWGAIALPSATGNVIPAAATDVSLIAVSPDGGTIIAVDNETGAIYRSTNGGTTFTAATGPTPFPVTALAISPAFATDSTIYAAAGAPGILYRSTDGGITFVQVAAAMTVATQTITSIALDPNFAISQLLVVGTADSVGGAFGDVFSLNRPLTFGWTAEGLNLDITAVAFSPQYPSDRTILAIGSSAAATTLNSQVNWEAVWNVSFGAAAAINAATDIGTGALDIVSSSLALPSDYMGMNLLARIAYVTTISAVADNVWRVSNATATILAFPVGATALSSLSFSGTTAAGTLFAGNSLAAQIYRSTNAPTATLGATWIGASQAPTGATATQVVAAPDFATSGTVYGGTTGAESAFSISMDGGVTFYQTALIHTTITNIQDATPSPTYATDGIIFMVTANAAGPESLWKSGSSWTRVSTLASTNGTAIVRLSPAYATDGTVIFAETGANTSAMRKSVNAGASWAVMVSITWIADIVVEDTTTLYVASARTAAPIGKVEKNINGAWHWGAGTAGTAALNSITQNANGDLLVGNTAGLVYRSTDAGMTYTDTTGLASKQIGLGIGGGNVVTAFDANYATNGIVYAGAPTITGVWRINASTASTITAWAQIDTNTVSAGIQPAGVSGIVVAPDGTLYAADPTAAAAGPPAAGGVTRSLSPTAGIAVLGVVAGTTFEQVSTGDGFAGGETLVSLAYTAGSNVLFGIDSANTSLESYTDTLTGAVAPSSPANNAKITSTTFAVLAWTAVTGATSYTVAVNSTSDFLGTAQTFTITAATVANPIPSSGVASGLTAGATYYWMVRVATPVLGAWSTGRSFITSLTAPALPAQPVIPANGGIGVTVLPTFSWNVIAGATNYEFVLGEDLTFAIIDYSANTTSNIFVTKEQLAFSTTYYWRVRATSASTTSAWTIYSFTTVAKPVVPEQVWTCILGLTFDSEEALKEHNDAVHAPPATVYICPVDGLVFDAEQDLADHYNKFHRSAELTEPTPVIPTYLLWIIVGIGAVLVISLIVLIVRTRRVA
jgi:hypothetical protein